MQVNERQTKEDEMLHINLPSALRIGGSFFEHQAVLVHHAAFAESTIVRGAGSTTSLHIIDVRAEFDRSIFSSRPRPH